MISSFEIMRPLPFFFAICNLSSEVIPSGAIHHRSHYQQTCPPCLTDPPGAKPCVMQSPYSPALRAEIRQRISSPNRESVAEIARSTGVNAQTLNSWHHRWEAGRQVGIGHQQGT